MNLSVDPYAPPLAVVADATTTQLPLASRWRRLLAALIDLALLVAVLFAAQWVLMALTGFDVFADDGDDSWETILWGVDLKTDLAEFALYLLLQGPLLWLRAQTIGKLLTGIVIVGPDGQRADFFRILLRRDLPLRIANAWTLIGLVLGLIDVLFIFRKDRRCLHDLVAGTRVVLAR